MPVPVGAWPNKGFPISLSKKWPNFLHQKTPELVNLSRRWAGWLLALPCHATRKVLPGLSCAPLLFRRLFLFCALFLRSLFRSLFLSRSCSLSSKEEEISMYTVSDEVVTLFFFFCRHAHQLYRSWRAVVAAAGIGARRRKRRRGRRTGVESGDGAASLWLHEIDAMSSADL